jgi:hypothetical protein
VIINIHNTCIEGHDYARLYVYCDRIPAEEHFSYDCPYITHLQWSSMTMHSLLWWHGTYWKRVTTIGAICDAVALAIRGWIAVAIMARISTDRSMIPSSSVPGEGPLLT